VGKPTVLVTGASGFIGRALLTELLAYGYLVKAVVRSGRALPRGVRRIEVDDIGAMSVSDWAEWLEAGDLVVHCAALVHQMKADPDGLTDDYDLINRKATETLAKAAAEQGAGRFVFLSTIKVLGEETLPGLPFRADAAVKPSDPYAESKWRAEQALQSLAEETGLESVVIRPPLVYGPGVGANFAALIKLVRLGLPLPLGGIRNRRSMVAVGNLVNLIRVCLEHPNAPGRRFLVSDDDDVSIPELLRRLGEASSRRVMLVPVPQSWLLAFGHLLGKGEAVRRLCGSLEVDISETRRILDWKPPLTMDEALREMLG